MYCSSFEIGALFRNKNTLNLSSLNIFLYLSKQFLFYHISMIFIVDVIIERFSPKAASLLSGIMLSFFILLETSHTEIKEIILVFDT